MSRGGLEGHDPGNPGNWRNQPDPGMSSKKFVDGKHST